MHENELISLITAYLIGSVPFGLLITKLAGYGDIRSIGSGNIGTTNVLRTGNKLLALATLVGDMGKGWLALFIGYSIAPFPSEIAWWLIPFCALLGHCFPIWLSFKGGKGVATIFGIYLYFAFPLYALAAFGWIAAFALTRISSAGALVGLPLALLIYDFALEPNIGPHWSLWLCVGLMIYKHKENIERLAQGTEHKFSFSKKEKA
ncbi:MAG: glycerol-3-phosphate 1-O-acyltransferase PlsY [Rickettsiales bacterium]|nr:glycerol-3-phosphate 1-O-acyltransferase PlsY [Rickettsiales bacterium]